MQIYSSRKAVWHSDRIGQLRAGSDIVPLHLHFVISDLCNQDCHFCSYRMSGGFATEQFADEMGNRNPVRFIPTAKVKEILDDCAALGVRAIEFTGGGEPTVHADHIEIFAHAQSLGLQTGLVTNGVRLRDNPVYREFDWIRVSLDAGRPETYQGIRASKAWPKVIANMALVGTYKKPHFGVGFVVTEENYAELVEATHIARDVGAAYIRVSAVFSHEGSGRYTELRGKIAEQRREAKTLETEKFRVVDMFGDRIEDLDQGAPDYSFCGQQQFVLYIGGDQKVYRCCTNAYTKHGEIGDLSQQRFREWIKGNRRYDFNAKSCHHCQFNEKNREIAYMLDPGPAHVNFV